MALPNLGWFSDLITTHAYEDSLARADRRTWNFIGFTLTDNPATGMLEIRVGENGVLPIEQGGTGLDEIGLPDEVLQVNSTGDALEYEKIQNANVHATAAIAGTKISPDFGDQDVVADSYNSRSEDQLLLRADYAAEQDEAIRFQRGGFPLLNLGDDVAGFVYLRPGQTAAAFVFTALPSLSGMGAPMLIYAQESASGEDGPPLEIGGGEAGDPGSNFRGDTIVQLGTVVSGASASCIWDANGTEVARVFRAAGGEANLTAVNDLLLNATSGQVDLQTAGVSRIEVTSTVLVNPTITHSQGEIQTGAISPAALASGGTDNWNPTSLATCRIIRASTDAGGSTVTGIVAQETGRRITLINIGSVGSLTLSHDTTSTAANRFLNPSAGAVVIPVNGSVDLWYDGTSSRWRVLT